MNAYTPAPASPLRAEQAPPRRQKRRSRKRRERPGLRFEIDASLYRLQQLALAASVFPGNRLWHLFLSPGQPRPRATAIRELERRYRALLEADLDNVRSGAYPRELLFQFPLLEYLTALPKALADVPRILWRSYAGRQAELPAGVDRSRFPKYYLRTFHWQTDGWLSDRSAHLYDGTVEFLFAGTADVMRRMAIPPVAQALAAKRRPRVLDLACGTGRFLRQLHATLPKAKLYGLDLSPHYLRRARALFPADADVSLLAENAEAVPFADSSFDAVTSIFLFHELPSDARRRVVREAYRVLKPGGSLVICDSAQLADSAVVEDVLHAFPRAYHEPYYKGYLRDDIAAFVTDAGFVVEDSTPHLVSKVVVASKPSTAPDTRD